MVIPRGLSLGETLTSFQSFLSLATVAADSCDEEEISWGIGIPRTAESVFARVRPGLGVVSFPEGIVDVGGAGIELMRISESWKVFEKIWERESSFSVSTSSQARGPRDLKGSW